MHWKSFKFEKTAEKLWIEVFFNILLYLYQFLNNFSMTDLNPPPAERFTPYNTYNDDVRRSIYNSFLMTGIKDWGGTRAYTVIFAL